MPALQILENTQWYYRIPNFRSMRRRGFRSLVVAFSVFTACVVPHFGLFVNLIGSVACTLLAFIFPSLFYLRLANPGTKTRRFIIACVVFGFIGGGISFVLTIVEFIELAAGDGNPSAA